MTSKPHSALLKAAQRDVEAGEQGLRGAYAIAIIRLEEQLEAVKIAAETFSEDAVRYRDALEWIERKATDPSAAQRARNALSNPASRQDG